MYRFLLVVLGLSLISPALAQTPEQPKPDVIVEGSVTHEANLGYRLLPFQVPEGVQRITVQLSYTERDKRTAIDLGLFDPKRFRGWSGGNKSSFTISETDATPSYLAGPILPGTWQVLLGIASIREGVRSQYTVKIYFSKQNGSFTAFSNPIRKAPGWYRGDLHMHTAHSDGSCLSQSGRAVPCPLFKILEAATQRKLDFVAVSDHNTTSHYDAERELAPYFDNLLLLHAREITTYSGHANLFGTDEFVDFRLGTPKAPNINSILSKAHATGGVLSINHPGRPTGEQCIGCGWSPMPPADMSLVQAVEAINGDDADTNVSGIPFWEEQLNKGFHLTALAGSDSHHADAPLDNFGTVGRPLTVIYAQELSEAGILDGIRAGHVYLDTEGSSDRTLSFTANCSGRTAMMGDSLPALAGKAVELNASTSEAKAVIEFIEDGKIMRSIPVAKQDEKESLSITSDGKPHWVRINVRSQSHKLLLLGNPIYLTVEN